MRVDAARNRERILAGADKLVQRQGTDFRMDQLATVAGVAVGTLYRHFATKELLLTEVAEQHAKRLAGAAADALARARREGSAREALRRFYSLVTDQHDMRAAARYVGSLLGAGGPPMSAAGQTAARSLDALMDFAKQRGEVREDITAADILLLLERAPAAASPARRARYMFLLGEAVRPLAAPGRDEVLRPPSQRV